MAHRALSSPGARVWRGATTEPAVAGGWRSSLVRPQRVPAPRCRSIVGHATHRHLALCPDTAYGTRSVLHRGTPANAAPDPAGRRRVRGARTLRAGRPLRPRYRDAGLGGCATARPGAPGRRNAGGAHRGVVDARPPAVGTCRDGGVVRDVD